MVNFERDKGIERDAFLLITSVGHKKIRSPLEESNLRPSDFRCSATEPLSTLLILGNMQDACHMNSIIDLAHRRVSVAQCDGIFFLCPTLVTRRKTSFSGQDTVI